MPGVLGAAAIKTVVAEEYYGQGILMATDAAAPRNVAVLTPWLVKLPSAHLAGGLLDTIQGVAADDAGFQFVFGCFQVFRDACLFCHSLFSHSREINSLA